MEGEQEKLKFFRPIKERRPKKNDKIKEKGLSKNEKIIQREYLNYSGQVLKAKGPKKKKKKKRRTRKIKIFFQQNTVVKATEES